MPNSSRNSVKGLGTAEHEILCQANVYSPPTVCLVVSTDGARAAEPREEHHGVCDTRKGGKSYHVNSATHDDTVVLFPVLQHS